MQINKAALAVAIAAVILVVAAAAFIYLGGGEAATVKASTITVGLSTFDVVEQFHDEVVPEGLTIEVIRFQLPPQSVDALVKGEVQLTVIPVELAAVTMNKGGDVYIVALDNMVNQAIIAPPDSGIKSPEDLKGKRVAAVVGSGTYYLFKSFMKQLYGINVTEGPDSDVIIINVRPGEVLDAILQGDADAGVIWDPIVSLAITKYGFNVVASYQDLWREYYGDTQMPMLVWVARAEVVEDRDLLLKVLEAHRNAALFWNNESERTIQMLIDLYKLDPEVARVVWERNQMYTGLCITEELKDAMIEIWRLAAEAGYLEKVPEPGRIVSCGDLGIQP